MKKRQQQKEETRQRLLVTAKRLFIEQGYEPTTTRQLAAACDVSVGTVFSHFPDKTTLLQAILYEDVETALSAAQTQLTSETHAVDTLLITAKPLYRLYAEHPSMSRALLTATVFDRASFGAQLQGFIDGLAERLIRLEGHSMEAALINARALMANYFFVLVEGLGEDTADADLWVERLARLCQGYRAETGQA